MKFRILQALVLFAWMMVVSGRLVHADDSQYKLGPDSQVKPDVPQGKITEHTWSSKIFEGTNRRYYVYLPCAGCGAN